MNRDASDRESMAAALSLAAKGKGWTSPNPCVGAVVVRGGLVVGRGYHHRAGRPHAEVNALRQAGARARGATLYVTLEPCSHHGRTPPCVDRILGSGVTRVVVAMSDPNPAVRGRGLRKLRTAGVEVVTGVLGDEARRLNEDFLKYITTGRPFVTLKLALTLDGKIATHTGDSKWITSPLARQRAHQLRHEHDAVVVGRGTLTADNPRLTTRLPRGKRGKDAARVVVASSGAVNPSAAAFAPGEVRRFVVCCRLPSRARLRKLRDLGVEVLEVGVRGGRVDLRAAAEALAAQGLTSLMIEGGSGLASGALEAGIVDKVAFFYGPVLLGGEHSLPSLAGPDPARIADARRLSHVTVETLGDNFLVLGYPHSPAS